MCRQREIIKQHKLAEEEEAYGYPKGDQASYVPSIRDASRSASYVSAVAAELESMPTSSNLKNDPNREFYETGRFG